MNDWRNSAIPALGALVVAMGAFIVSGSAQTDEALATAVSGVTQVVAGHSAKLETHEQEIARLRDQAWENRP